MSVIVGSVDGWMVADTLVLHGPDRFKCNKIETFEHCLIGIAGQTSVQQQLREKIGDKDPKEALLGMFREKDRDASALYVGRDHVLRLISGDGCILEPQFNWWAIGAASDLVMGYLAGKKGMSLVTPKDAEEAIRWASLVNNTISPKTTLAKLRALVPELVVELLNDEETTLHEFTE